MDSRERNKQLAEEIKELTQRLTETQGDNKVKKDMIKLFKNSCFQPKLLIKPVQKIAISYKTFALRPSHVFNSTELPLPVKMAQSISFFSTQ